MKFAHYRSLANCFDFSIEKLDDESLSQLKEKVAHYFEFNDSLTCENQKYSMTDVFALIDSFRNPKTIIFHDWMKSDVAIYTVLQEEKEKLNFQEKISNKKYRGHTLEKEFYSFLTPFLYRLLEREITESIAGRDFEKLRFYLQYSAFLEESKNISLQQEVDRKLRSLFSTIGELNYEGKKVFANQQIELLASLNLVDILNLLDKQFYALRLNYIDTVKSIMKNPGIDPSTFKVLSRAIKKVELNSAHKSQVDSFLQQGKTSVYQKQKNKVFNKALLRNPLLYIGFVGIIILLLLVVPFDFTNKSPSLNEKISGLDSLSQAEVKKTDSLLAFKEDSTSFETDDMVVPLALPDFILSDNTSEIKNTVALKLYESMLNDYEIQQNKARMNCDPLDAEKLQEFNFKGVENLAPDFLNHKIKNESKEDCYLLYFENESGGKISGEFIPAGSSIELKLVINWRVIFYTGREFTSFNPLKTSNNGYGNLEDAKKIDKSFTTHFCEMNYSNFRVLSKIYQVESIGKTTQLYSNANGSLQIDSKSIRSVK